MMCLKDKVVGASAVILAVVLFTASCSGTNSSGTEDEEGGNGSARQLTVVQQDGPTGFNPSLGIETSQLAITQMILEPATKFIPKGQGKYDLEPWLVTSWHQVGAKEWKFKVRQDVKFSNGERLTAAAFKSSMQAILSEPGTEQSLAFKGFSLEVVDETTFVLHTPAPDMGSVPTLMTLFYLMPRKYLEKVGMEGFNENPVGTGPYTLAGFKQGVSATLEANKDYWGKSPSIARISVSGVADASTRLSQLLSGSADVVKSVPPSLVPRIKRSGSYEVRAVPTQTREFLLFNMFKSPSKEVKVRKAVNYALNTESIIDGLYKGFAAPLHGLYVPNDNGYVKGFDPYPYGPDKARQLLSAAGYPNGLTLDFYYSIGNTLLDKQLAQVIQGQLKKVGIKLDMHGGQSDVIVQKFRTGDVGGFLSISHATLGLGPYLTMQVYLTSNSISSKPNHSALITKLAGKAVQTADKERQAEIYSQIQRIAVADNAMIAPLFRFSDVYGVAKELEWTPASDGRYAFQTASF